MQGFAQAPISGGWAIGPVDRIGHPRRSWEGSVKTTPEQIDRLKAFIKFMTDGGYFDDGGLWANVLADFEEFQRENEVLRKEKKMLDKMRDLITGKGKP